MKLSKLLTIVVLSSAVVITPSLTEESNKMERSILNLDLKKDDIHLASTLSSLRCKLIYVLDGLESASKMVKREHKEKPNYHTEKYKIILEELELISQKVLVLADLAKD